MTIKVLCASSCFIVLAACGGGAASPVPARVAAPSSPSTSAPPSASAAASAHVVISIPPQSTSSAVKPAYVSASTQSVTVQVDGGSPTTQNLLASSSNCASAGASFPLNCTVTVNASAGVHTLTFATFDQQNAGGNELSTNSISVTFVAGQNPAIPVVLSGVPKSVVITPGSNSTTISVSNSLTAAPSIQWAWGVPQTLFIAALDADGNYIVGPGAPSLSTSISVTSGTPGITLVPASASNPNQFSLQSSGPGYATLTVTATPTSALAGNAVTTSMALGSVAVSAALIANPTMTFFEYGEGMAYDTNDGNLYVHDGAYCQILQVTPSGTQTSIAGSACPYPPPYNYVDGTGSVAQLSGDWAYMTSDLAYDSKNGDLYFADITNCSIRQITPAGVVTTVAGAPPPTPVCAFADGTTSAARFNAPRSIAYDPNNDTLYVGDAGNCAIRQMTPSGVVTTLTGSSAPTPTCGFTDGAVGTARMRDVTGIAFDTQDGNLYVTDRGNCAIRQVTTAGAVTTLVGSAPAARAACGYLDGTGTTTRFKYPSGIAFDADNGDLYVTDQNCAVRQVSTSNAAVVTIAGNPPPTPKCGFNAPYSGFGSGITFTGSITGPVYDHATGSLYVSDLAGIWQLIL